MTPGGSSGSVAPGPRPPFWAIVSITLTGIMANTLVTPAIPDIVRDLDVGTAAVGLMLAAVTAPGILLAPLIGVLADRFGRKELLIPCLVIFGLSGGLASFAPNYPTLLALRFGQGIGAAGLLNLAVVLIGDNWEGSERARMMGRNAACLTAAIAVLPPLGGGLAALGGWRLTFAPYWVALVTAVVLQRTLKRSPKGETSMTNLVRAAVPHLRTAVVAGSMFMSFVLFLLIFGAFLTVLPVHLADEFGIGPGLRGLVLATPAVTSTVTSLNIGRLRTRFGARLLLLAGSVFLAVGLLIMGVAGSLPVLLLAPVVYGFGEGLMIPTLQDVVAGAPPASSRGSVVAVYVGVTRAGQTIGPVLAGVGLESSTPRTLFVLGAVLAGGLAIGQQVARPRRTQDIATAITK